MYPNRTQYRDAVWNEMYPLDENGGQVFEPVLEKGEMVVIAGGTATVFKVKDRSGRTKALKLFTDEITDRFDRFEALSVFLSATHIGGLMGFSFSRKLIYVKMDDRKEDDSLFPGLVMDWVASPTLEDHLKTIVAAKDTTSLLILADNFRKLALRLMRNRIGHGDLKPSNILVRKNLDMVLIDYDGMFIEAFRGQPSFELGTPAYQHPARNKSDFNEDIDHFSILIIYTSLIALANDPGLTSYSDGEAMIIRYDDLLNPSVSRIFAELLSKPETRPYAYAVKKALASNSIAVPNLAAVLNGRFSVPVIEVRQSPKQAVEGEMLRISWKTRDADFVRLNGKATSLEGNRDGLAALYSRFEFEYGTEGEVVHFVFIPEVDRAPEIVSFGAVEMMIPVGKAARLFWEIHDCPKLLLYADGIATDVTDKTRLDVQPKFDTAYRLVAFSSTGRVADERTLTIRVIDPVVIESFAAKYDTVPESVANWLSWKVLFAKKITVHSSLGEEFGRQNRLNLRIVPSQSVTYTLLAENELFKEQSSCSVIVEPLPKVNLSLPPILPNGEPLAGNLDARELADMTELDAQAWFTKVFKPKRERHRTGLMRMFRWIFLNKI